MHSLFDDRYPLHSIRPLHVDDFSAMNSINMDPFTVTFSDDYYASYLREWPEYCYSATATVGSMAGYMISKAVGHEDGDEERHSHITAVTVAKEFRRTRVASILIDHLEKLSEDDYEARFCDLFVRTDNEAAIKLYERLGYSVYRKILQYYSNGDAYDMRKPLKYDPEQKSLITGKRVITQDEMD